jgi:hypothetical protein
VRNDCTSQVKKYTSSRIISRIQLFYLLACPRHNTRSVCHCQDALSSVEDWEFPFKFSKCPISSFFFVCALLFSIRDKSYNSNLIGSCLFLQYYSTVKWFFPTRVPLLFTSRGLNTPSDLASHFSTVQATVGDYTCSLIGCFFTFSLVAESPFLVCSVHPLFCPSSPFFSSLSPLTLSWFLTWPD